MGFSWRGVVCGFATTVAVVAALVSSRLETRERADGGPGHGLKLLVSSLDSPHGDDGGPTTEFDGEDSVPDLARARALGLVDRTRRFRASWTGWLRAEVDGIYAFATFSDDGSRLTVDGVRVVENGGVHGAQARTGRIRLLRGWHPLEVEYTQEGADLALDVTWAAPNAVPRKLEPDVLYSEPPGPMTLWWIENLDEPLARHGARIRGVRDAAAVVALGFAVSGLRRSRLGSAVLHRCWVALGSVLAGSPARRRVSMLLSLFLLSGLVSIESDSMAGGFRAHHRSLSRPSAGPWLDDGVDRIGPNGERGDAHSQTTVTVPEDRRWDGWVFASTSGFHEFRVAGDPRAQVSVDGEWVVDHPGSAQRDAPTRGRAWLKAGVHAVRLTSTRRDRHDGPATFTWARPSEPFATFATSDVFVNPPGRALLASQVHSGAARPAVRRLVGAWIIIAFAAVVARRRTVRRPP